MVTYKPSNETLLRIADICFEEERQTDKRMYPRKPNCDLSRVVRAMIESPQSIKQIDANSLGSVFSSDARVPRETQER